MCKVKYHFRRCPSRLGLTGWHWINKRQLSVSSDRPVTALVFWATYQFHFFHVFRGRPDGRRPSTDIIPHSPGEEGRRPSTELDAHQRVFWEIHTIAARLFLYIHSTIVFFMSSLETRRSDKIRPENDTPHIIRIIHRSVVESLVSLSLSVLCVVFSETSIWTHGTFRLS